MNPSTFTSNSNGTISESVTWVVGVVDNFNDPAPTHRHTPPLKVGGASLAKIKNLLGQPQV